MHPSLPSSNPFLSPQMNPSAPCRLEGVDYVSTFQELRTKHEQNKEVVPNAFAT